MQEVNVLFSDLYLLHNINKCVQLKVLRVLLSHTKLYYLYLLGNLMNNYEWTQLIPRQFRYSHILIWQTIKSVDPYNFSAMTKQICFEPFASSCRKEGKAKNCGWSGANRFYADITSAILFRTDKTHKSSLFHFY